MVTSAGAIVEGLQALGAKRSTVVAPYMKPLTQMVVSYIEDEGIAVQDWLALEIPDNLEVAAQDPANLLDHYKKLDLTGIDALVLSACGRCLRCRQSRGSMTRWDCPWSQRRSARPSHAQAVGPRSARPRRRRATLRTVMTALSSFRAVVN